MDASVLQAGPAVPTPARLIAIVQWLLRSARGASGVGTQPALPQPQPLALPPDEAVSDASSARSYTQRLRSLSRMNAQAEAAAIDTARNPALSTAQREAARHDIVRANLWLVPVVVRRYHPSSGGAFDDLVAEGNIGLYRALERFDPSRGFRFSTYAKWWVVDAVTAAMAANAHPVRMPRRVAQALARSRREQGSPADGSGAAGEAPPDPEQATHELMDVALADTQPAESLLAQDEQGLQDNEPRPDEIVELREALKLLAQAVTELPARERRVIESRYGLNGRSEETLQQIGDDLGVTAERVRTLQLAAMAMLRRRFEQPAPRALA
jgi:RNA polymerase sigma factor (sigma-70 family)